jgi:hypothetical protein
MKMIWQKIVGIGIADAIRVQRIFLQKEAKVFMVSEEQFVTDCVIKKMIDAIWVKWDVIFAHS